MMPYKDFKKAKEYAKQYRKLNKDRLNEEHRQRYKNNPEKRKEYKEQYRKDNIEKIMENHRQWAKNNPEKIKKYQKCHRLKKKYGLSYEDWLVMWEEQDGKCKICGEIFIKPSDAHVDHDHITNKIRGLLCAKCNFGISYFNDDLRLIAKVIEYLLGGKG